MLRQVELTSLIPRGNRKSITLSSLVPRYCSVLENWKRRSDKLSENLYSMMLLQFSWSSKKQSFTISLYSDFTFIDLQRFLRIFLAFPKKKWSDLIGHEGTYLKATSQRHVSSEYLRVALPWVFPNMQPPSYIQSLKQQQVRCITKNFLGQVTFLGIKAFWQTSCTTEEKKFTQGKSPVFLPEIS